MRTITGKIFLAVLLAAIPEVHSQEIGFGCFGLFGGYAGYQYQNYKATGLNNYIDVYNEFHNDSLTTPFNPFKRAEGFRFGVNIIRLNYDDVFFTLKGFYTGLSEKSTSTYKSGNRFYDNSIELEFNNFGFGVDLGTGITSFLSWKIIDAEVVYNRTELKTVFKTPGQPTDSKTYELTKDVLGFTFGSGVVIHIIEKYLSIEGTAGFTTLTIESMQLENGKMFPETPFSDQPSKNFIEEGGFMAVIQLNLGLPI